jgi:hypothetical protein
VSLINLLLNEPWWPLPPDADYVGEDKLSELGGMHPIPEWREITWHECESCGGSSCYGPADEDEKLYDGEPVVCAECGYVHQMSVDENGWDVLAHGESLRPTALWGFRRLLGVK